MQRRQPDVVRVFRRAPRIWRLKYLARMAITGDERPLLAISKLLELLSLMISFLPQEQRLIAAQQLRFEASNIDGLDPYGQGALH